MGTAVDTSIVVWATRTSCRPIGTPAECCGNGQRWGGREDDPSSAEFIRCGSDGPCSGCCARSAVVLLIRWTTAFCGCYGTTGAAGACGALRCL